MNSGPIQPMTTRNNVSCIPQGSTHMPQSHDHLKHCVLIVCYLEEIHHHFGVLPDAQLLAKLHPLDIGLLMRHIKENLTIMMVFGEDAWLYWCISVKPSCNILGQVLRDTFGSLHLQAYFLGMGKDVEPAYVAHIFPCLLCIRCPTSNTAVFVGSLSTMDPLFDIGIIGTP